MSKRKIHRLNKDCLVQKVNELIGVVNHQQEIINDFERILKNQGGKR